MKEKQYEEIKREVRNKKEWYINIFLWIFFMVIAIPINLIFTNSRNLWSVMIAVGWLLVIIVHYLAVFGIPFVSKIGSKWEEQEIERKLEELDEKESLDLNQPLDLKEIKKNYRDSDLV